jgi:hypothetical protein
MFHGEESLHLQDHGINQASKLQGTSKSSETSVSDYTASHPEAENVLHGEGRENLKSLIRAVFCFKLDVNCYLVFRALRLWRGAM